MSHSCLSVLLFFPYVFPPAFHRFFPYYVDYLFTRALHRYGVSSGAMSHNATLTEEKAFQEALAPDYFAAGF